MRAESAEVARWTVVIPFKGAPEGKSRLAGGARFDSGAASHGFTASERALLAQAFLTDTLAAVVKLDRKPPDFADARWQNSVTDDEIKKAIVDGGASLGKSKMMPALHDLDGTPELDELVALIRGH